MPPACGNRCNFNLHKETYVRATSRANSLEDRLDSLYAQRLAIVYGLNAQFIVSMRAPVPHQSRLHRARHTSQNPRHVVGEDKRQRHDDVAGRRPAHDSHSAPPHTHANAAARCGWHRGECLLRGPFIVRASGYLLGSSVCALTTVTHRTRQRGARSQMAKHES